MSKPTPVKCTSKVLRAFFEEMERCGIPATVYHARAPKEACTWKSGKYAPKILTVEEMLDANGYELIMRKKET